MRYKRERSFLRKLCKGHIQDLIAEVGWSKIQCAMITKRYLEFKSVPRICMETGLSESGYKDQFNNILAKLHSHLVYSKDEDLLNIYISS